MKFRFSDEIYNHEYDETPAQIDKWYFRKTKSWVVQLKNKAGDQLGNAYYCYTKQEAEEEVKRLKAEYNL